MSKMKSKFYPILRVLSRKAGSALLSLGVTLREWGTAESFLPTPSQSKREAGGNLALIAGYFSFRDGLSTFGDTEAMRVVMDWFNEAGIPFDIACHCSTGLRGLDIANLDASRYNIFVYVCGPWRNENKRILNRFSHCTKIGINLSLEDPIDHGFDLLLPRDLPSIHNPDVVFASKVPELPVVGVCLAHPQFEYGNRQRHDIVKKIVYNYLSKNEIAYIEIDTLTSRNRTGIKNSIAFENIVSRLDVVISSRLHGLVFALKRGIPVVAIDAIAGGAKVTNQAKALGWPIIINGNDINEDKIREAVSQCLSETMKMNAADVKMIALKRLEQIKTIFIKELASISSHN